jgi:hypothetical protein
MLALRNHDNAKRTINKVEGDRDVFYTLVLHLLTVATCLPRRDCRKRVLEDIATSRIHQWRGPLLDSMGSGTYYGSRKTQ